MGGSKSKKIENIRWKGNELSVMRGCSIGMWGHRFLEEDAIPAFIHSAILPIHHFSILPRRKKNPFPFTIPQSAMLLFWPFCQLFISAILPFCHSAILPAPRGGSADHGTAGGHPGGGAGRGVPHPTRTNHAQNIPGSFWRLAR